MSDISAPEKFKDKTEQRGNCLIWTGATDEDGYGRVRDGKRVIGAHRYAYEWAHPETGDLPSTVCVSNIPECPTGKACVNPAHVDVYTKQEVLLRSPETESGKHKRQMRCKRGHPFTLDNTYVYNGSRRCRTCQNQRQTLNRKLREKTERREEE